MDWLARGKQQDLCSRTCASGGGNILHPNKYHLPISFYLPTDPSVGVNRQAWAGSRHSVEGGEEAGLNHGVQQVLGCKMAHGAWTTAPWGMLLSNLLTQGEGLAVLGPALPRGTQEKWSA